jgi:hypothetical protein
MREEEGTYRGDSNQVKRRRERQCTPIRVVLSFAAFARTYFCYFFLAASLSRPRGPFDSSSAISLVAPPTLPRARAGLPRVAYCCLCALRRLLRLSCLSPLTLTSHLSPLTPHLSPVTSHLSPLAAPLTSHLSRLSPLTSPCSHLSPLTSLTSHTSPLTSLTSHTSLTSPLTSPLLTALTSYLSPLTSLLSSYLSHLSPL